MVDRRSLFVALAIFIIAAGVYLATLSRHYSGDSLMFARLIGAADFRAMIMRQHLLMNPLGYGFVTLWQWVTSDPGVLLPLQVLNALCGALSVTLFYMAVVGATGSTVSALPAAVAFGVSNGLWCFSIEAEMVTPALALMMGALLYAVRFVVRSPTGGSVIRAALLVSVATLFYVTNAYLLPVDALSLWLAQGPSRLARHRLIGTLLATGGFCIAGGYAAHAMLTGDRPLSFNGLYQGLGSGRLYGTVAPANVVFGGYAFLRTIVNYPFIPVDMFSRTFLRSSTAPVVAGFFIFYLVVAVLVVVPVVVMVRGWRAAAPVDRHLMTVMGLLAGLFGGFACVWMPTDQQFWLPVATAWWFVCGLAVGRHGGRWHGGLLLLMLVMGGLNFVGSVAPRRSLASNQEYVVATSVAEHTRPDDLVATISDNRYIPYFSGRRTVSFLETALAASALGENDVQGRAADELERRFASVRQAGGRVFLYLELLDEESLRRYARAGLTPPDWERFRMAPAWTSARGRFVEILPEPRGEPPARQD